MLCVCCNFKFVMVFELTWKRQMSPPPPGLQHGNNDQDDDNDGMVTQISGFTSQPLERRPRLKNLFAFCSVVEACRLFCSKFPQIN